MPDARERIAAALYAADPACPNRLADWEDCSEETQARYLTLADAAIAVEGVSLDCPGPDDSHEAVADALASQRPDPEAAHAAAADRLSWSGSEGLIITPPPGQEK